MKIVRLKNSLLNNLLYTQSNKTLKQFKLGCLLLRGRINPRLKYTIQWKYKHFIWTRSSQSHNNLFKVNSIYEI